MVTSDRTGNPPDQADLESWAALAPMTSVPALGVPAEDQDELTDLAYLFEADFYIPTVYHLDENMKVLSADELIDDPGVFLGDGQREGGPAV